MDKLIIDGLPVCPYRKCVYESGNNGALILTCPELTGSETVKAF